MRGLWSVLRSGVCARALGASVLIVVMAALLSVFTPASGRAYSAAEAYVETAAVGGGGGRWFTGSPADGYGCNVCHSSTAEQRSYPLYAVGLPGRYQPEWSYDVVLSWPELSQRWTELRPDPTVRSAPGVAVPGMGMIGEIVAISGLGSGTIEIGLAPATPGELCESVSASIAPRLATRLFQVRAGLPPLLVRPDEQGVLRCESRQLAQRCILALSSCGAREVRFRWTAPEREHDTLWFSAGFVATEALSSTAQGDSVYELVVPVVAAQSESGFYEETLENASCSVGRGPSGSGSVLKALAVLAVLAGSALSLAVRARRRRLRGVR